MSEIDLIEEINDIELSGYLLFTTFKFNPQFFEKNIFFRFKNKVAPIVLTDESEYHARLQELSFSKLANKKYFLQYARSHGTFHPKLALSVNENEVRILLGSNNLTREGYTSNAELVVPIIIDLERRESGHLLSEIKDFLQCLEERTPGNEYKVEIRKIIQAIPDYEDNSNRDMWLIHSMKKPILETVLGIIGEPITEIEVFSPFFSQDMDFFKELMRLTPKIHIMVQDGKSNLPVLPFEKLTGASFSTVESERYIHAKMLCFETKNSNYLLVGSANCTRPALLTTDNVELVALIRTSRSVGDIVSKIGLMTDAKPSSVVRAEIEGDEPYEPPDLHIEEAVKKGQTLRVVLTEQTSGSGIVLVLDGVVKKWKFKTQGNIIEFQIPDDEQSLFSKTVIASISVEEGGIILTSDVVLVHNKTIFEDTYDLLNSVNMSDANWLFQVLRKLSKMQDFGSYVRLLDELDDVLLKMGSQEKAVEWLISKKTKQVVKDQNIQSTTLGDVIAGFVHRHGSRIDRAIENQELDARVQMTNSFVLLNKLSLFCYSRNYLPTGYAAYELLPDIRINLEIFFLNDSCYYDQLLANGHKPFLQESNLKYHVAIISYAVDLLQRSSPEYAPNPRLGYSPVRRKFQETDFSCLNKVLATEGKELLSKTLDKYLEEYAEILPQLANLDSTQFMNDLCLMIDNVNVFLRPKCVKPVLI